MSPVVRIVFVKEVIDNFRDRRALVSALIMPLVMVLSLVGSSTLVGQSIQEHVEADLRVPIVGAERAPNLIKFLEQQEVEILPPVPDPRAAVESGEHPVVLIIPESFADELKEARPARVDAYYQEAKRGSMITFRRLQRLIGAYGKSIGVKRLIARGLDPSLTRAVVVDEIDVSRVERGLSAMLGMIPGFIMMAVFLGGLYVAIDTTAGERERGSLEPLLINPVKRWEVVLGKLGATVLFSILCLVESIAAFYFVTRFSSAEVIEGLGMRLDWTPAVIVSTFLILAPVAFLAASLQMLIAVFGRSFKEAQTYTSLLVMLPMVPVFYLMAAPDQPPAWNRFVPTLAEQVLLRDLFQGEGLVAAEAWTTAGCTMGCGVVVTALVIWLYSGERVLQGSGSAD